MVLHDGGAVAAIILHRTTLFSAVNGHLGPVGQGSLQPYGTVIWAAEWPITLKRRKAYIAFSIDFAVCRMTVTNVGPARPTRTDDMPQIRS